MNEKNNAVAQDDIRALAQQLAQAERTLLQARAAADQASDAAERAQAAFAAASNEAFELRGKMQSALQERYQAFVIEQCGFDPFAPVLEVQP